MVYSVKEYLPKGHSCYEHENMSLGITALRVVPYASTPPWMRTSNYNDMNFHRCMQESVHQCWQSIATSMYSCKKGCVIYQCELPYHKNAKQIQTLIALPSIYHHHTLSHSSSNIIHSAYILVEVLSVRAIGNLLFMDTGGSSGHVWFMASSFSCQSSFSVLASSVTGGLMGQSSLTFFSAKVAGAKILALGLYSGTSMTVSAVICYSL